MAYYKATHADKTGYNKFGPFEEGKIYEVEGEPKLCSNGFHFCQEAIQTLLYYSGEDDLLWEVEVLGDVVGDPKDKMATNKILMKRILGEEERKEKLTGLYRTWHSNSQLSYECNYKNGKMDGLYRSWYLNGQLDSEFNYKNGKFDGIQRTWHCDGQLFSECNYKDGKMDGLCRNWHSNGKLSYECNLKDGEKIFIVK